MQKYGIRLALGVWATLHVASLGCSNGTTDPATTTGGSGGGNSAHGGSDARGGGPGDVGGREPGGATHTWQEGLSEGPNGPIPLLLVDQFGYRPDDPKLALVRDPRTGYDATVDFAPGATYALIDAVSGATVKEGALTPWNGGAVDQKSGDAVWSFDFSDVTTPGTYYVLDVERGQRSPHFEIDDGVYRSVLRHALRTFFYQRAGVEKAAEHAGAEWADGASHIGAGQDTEARSWLDKSNPATARDLRGGWYDAGDYNKYTSWHARYLITLLRTYVLHPQAFTDELGIPESGNGTPDLLDEVRFGLEWLTRMQNEDGSSLCIQGLAHGTPPSSATAPSYYGPPTTAATLASAAAFAYAARVFGARSEPDFAELAEDYRARAQRAWAFASANPSLTYFNNDEGKQPGSRGLAAGQQEVDDAARRAWKVEAAAYLFEQTGEASYREFFDQNYAATLPTYGLSHWQVDRHEAVLDYAAQSGATPDVVSAIHSQFLQRLRANDGPLRAATTHQDAYRSAISAFTWGSNQSKAAAGRLLLLNADYGLDAATTADARAGAGDHLHYLHGVNPLGLVYLTHMESAGAEHSAKTVYHSWFSYRSARWSEVSATTPGPPPGFLVGGPNPSFSVDACCSDGSQCNGAADFSFCALSWSPPLGQPHAKAYKQFNLGWPANSWSVTENSNGYQVQYIRLLAAFAH